MGTKSLLHIIKTAINMRYPHGQTHQIRRGAAGEQSLFGQWWVEVGRRSGCTASIVYVSDGRTRTPLPYIAPVVTDFDVLLISRCIQTEQCAE